MYTREQLQKLETLEEIKEILSAATFPCAFNDLLKCAKDADAPKRIMNILRMIEDSQKKFENINEVADRLADILKIED